MPLVRLPEQPFSALAHHPRGPRGRSRVAPALILTLALAVLAAPLAVGAQPAGKVYRIGWLGTTAPRTPDLMKIVEAFYQGLREHGFVEGQNIVIERRYAEGVEGRFTAFAAELLQMKVDLIVVTNSSAAHAAKQATSTIPIVMLAVANPERQGLVASLARPGGNVTGMSNQLAAEASGKMFQHLKDALPKLSKVAILWNPDNQGRAISFKEGEMPTAKALGMTLVSLEVREPADLERALAIVRREQPQVILPHLVMFPYRARIVDFATKNRLPIIAAARPWADRAA